MDADKKQRDNHGDGDRNRHATRNLSPGVYCRELDRLRVHIVRKRILTALLDGSPRIVLRKSLKALNSRNHVSARIMTAGR